MIYSMVISGTPLALFRKGQKRANGVALALFCLMTVKVYMTVIRPVLLYGAECRTVRKKEEQILEKIEMRMFRRIKGVTLRDRIKWVDIRKELGVSSIQEKVREIRLR